MLYITVPINYPLVIIRSDDIKRIKYFQIRCHTLFFSF
jgi:hypothetical protein